MEGMKKDWTIVVSPIGETMANSKRLATLELFGQTMFDAHKIAHVLADRLHGSFILLSYIEKE